MFLLNVSTAIVSLWKHDRQCLDLLGMLTLVESLFESWHINGMLKLLSKCKATSHCFSPADTLQTM